MAAAVTWLSKLVTLLNTPVGTINQPVSKTGETPSKEQKSAETSAKEEARNRLKLVLMHDRTQLSKEVMTKMRDEMVSVISKYVEIDQDALELNLESESNTIALVANIPVVRNRAK